MRKKILALALCLALLWSGALAEPDQGRYIDRKDGKYALTDGSGFLLTDYIYDTIDVWRGGPPYAVLRDGKWGFIDALGREVVPVIYDEIDHVLHEHVAAVRLNDKWGYVDDEGRLVIGPWFDWADSFEDGLAIVEVNHKYGYIGHDGSYVVEPQFDLMNSFGNGLAVVALNNKYGIIDRDGRFVTEPQFDEIDHYYEGPAVVRIGDKYGYIDRDGRIMIEPQFDNAYGFGSGDYAKVEIDGKHGLIDRTGAWVLEPQFSGFAAFHVDDDGLISVTEDEGKTFRYFDMSSGAAVEVRPVGSKIDLSDYMPFEGKKVAVLSEERTLGKRVTEARRLPCLDGATALFPVYSAFCQAVYPRATRYTAPDDLAEGVDALITCTKTNRAYERLIAGEADVIFVAQPSDEELAMATEKGVEFDMIPIGKEAFVFIVNRDNPLDGIALDQIRGVYSGAITDWSQLGVEGLGPITAYQRPKNSGSQTALEALMGDTPLMDAPQGTVAIEMDDIVDTIEYRNTSNAIGYSFRFFCIDMMGSDVKLLAVDGVEPTEANIRNGSYPLSTTIYAIRLVGNDNPNVVALLDWIRSPQGMELVEKSGYTPWEY